MPLDPAIIAEIDAYLASKITKVRIPELPPYSTFGEISLLDRIPLWMNSVNKSVWVDSLTYKTLLTTGGTGTITPVLTGTTLIIEADATEAGTDTILRTELEGKTYFLRLEGRPLKLGTEWELLTGGFKLLGGATLTEGQRFDADIYELRDTSSGGPAALSSSYITGIVEVSANTFLNGVTHSNKLISIRAALNAINIILPDTATTPEKAIILIESQINNTKQSLIQTTGGQFIYMNNTSFTTIYIGKGEVCALLRTADGWVVLNDFGNYYKNLGKPYAAYSAEDNENEFLCDGSDVLKIDAPRLWEKIQTLGGALTSDPAVYAANPGMWLHKDTATFSLPDLRGLFLRGADTETPGTFQDEMVKAQTFTLPQVQHNASGVPVGVTDGPLGGPGSRTYTVGTGTETRPKNTLIQWVVKY